ncbi:hypothetical protein [Streptococcus cristatus]|uniref:hypothetical protein n=1 Tax=Streptococcus cristatus TaxID=45634 RepID=UPI0007829339|nr:hypothetical protein [Streptococcus cristatus]
MLKETIEALKENSIDEQSIKDRINRYFYEQGLEELIAAVCLVEKYYGSYWCVGNFSMNTTKVDGLGFRIGLDNKYGKMNIFVNENGVDRIDAGYQELPSLVNLYFNLSELDLADELDKMLSGLVD